MPSTPRAAPPGAVLRAARKELARIERELDRSATREAQLHEQMAAAATDHARLRELNGQLAELTAAREELEAAWLETSEVLEG